MPGPARKRLQGAQTFPRFTDCSPSLANYVPSGPNTLPHHWLHSGSAPATFLGTLLQGVEDHVRPSPSLPETRNPEPGTGVRTDRPRGDRQELTQSPRGLLRSLFGKGSLVGAPKPVSNAPDSHGEARAAELRGLEGTHLSICAGWPAARPAEVTSECRSAKPAPLPADSPSISLGGCDCGPHCPATPSAAARRNFLRPFEGARGAGTDGPIGTAAGKLSIFSLTGAAGSCSSYLTATSVPSCWSSKGAAAWMCWSF